MASGLKYFWTGWVSVNCKRNMKVEEFAKNLQQFPPSKWEGSSDHRVHAQVVKLKSQRTTTEFVLATFNLLAYDWLKYQNGIWPNNEVPSWYSLEGQQGLESTPLADPKNNQARERANLEIIKSLFSDKSRPVILCLQECRGEMRRAVMEFAECFNIEFDAVATEDKMVMWRGLEMYPRYHSDLHDNYIVSATSGHSFGLVNVHLNFKTESNQAVFREILDKCRIVFVVGDYNIQTKPISEKTKSEGSYMTLSEFVDSCIIGHWETYELAQHTNGWTNFNCRKNCVDPLDNADHMDNILFLSNDTAQWAEFTFLPVHEPAKWWITE